jgi:hypothetical protein
VKLGWGQRHKTCVGVKYYTGKQPATANGVSSVDLPAQRVEDNPTAGVRVSRKADDWTIGVPTVLRIGPYRFHFFANDGGEPPHVHVTGPSKTVKVWLATLTPVRPAGYAAHELREVIALVGEHRDQLQEKWDEYFRRNP